MRLLLDAVATMDEFKTFGDNGRIFKKKVGATVTDQTKITLLSPHRSLWDVVFSKTETKQIICTPAIM